MVGVRHFTSWLWLAVGIPASVSVGFALFGFLCIAVGNGFEIDKEPTSVEWWCRKAGPWIAIVVAIAGIACCVLKFIKAGREDSLAKLAAVALREAEEGKTRPMDEVL